MIPIISEPPFAIVNGVRFLRNFMDKKILIPTIALIVLAGIFIGVWLFMKSKSKDTSAPYAEIRQNGEVIRVVPLDEDREFTVTCGEGSNTIRVANGEISVISADCPDKVCVKTGAISGGNIPIVCLPHRLEIIIVNSDNVTDAQI